MSFVRPSRPLTRRLSPWLLAAAAAVVLAVLPVVVSAQSGATVSVGSAGSLGDVLVGPDGRTLYTFDPDTGGVSVCYDTCEQNWPPLTVESGAPIAGDGVTGALGTHEREDGSMQVTYDGRPVYYFAGDAAPGQANGQGINNVWFVINVSADDDDDGTATGTATATSTSSATGTPAAPTTGTGLADGDSGLDRVFVLLVAAAVAAGGAGVFALMRRD